MVILGSDFERLQIIPGAKHGNIQVGCVDCSLQGGQVRSMGFDLVLNKCGREAKFSVSVKSNLCKNCVKMFHIPFF